MGAVGAVLLLLAATVVPLSAARDISLNASDYSGVPLSNDRYGSAMASSGDWLAIGAPVKVTNSTLPSYAYVGGRVVLWKKEAATGNWIQQQVLTAPGVDGTDPANGFGTTLAMEGQTLLVSSYPDSVKHRVHVFRRDAAGVWQADGLLTPLTTGTPAGFGRVMVLQGDLAVISSPVAASSTGRVDVFRRENDAWAHATQLIPATPVVGEQFGSALAFHGSTILVGAPAYFTEVDKPEIGRVAVFTASGNTWVWSRNRLANPVTAEQRFGSGISVQGDTLRVLGAGNLAHFDIAADYAWLMSSTYSSSSSLTLQGSLMVGLDTTNQKITLYRPSADGFWDYETSFEQTDHGLNAGITVHIAGNEVLLGGTLIDTGINAAVRPSTVLNLRKPPGSYWQLRPAIVPAEILRLRHMDFGIGMAAGQTWAALGCPSKAPAWERRQDGLVYIYRVRADGWQKFHSLLPAPVAPGLDLSHFGSQVAVSGDWIAVGAAQRIPSTPDFVASPGVVLYEYVTATNVWVQRAVLTPPVGVNGQGFGFALSMSGSGTGLLIGAPASRRGCLYQRTGQDWNLVKELTPSGGSGNVWLLEQFGTSVSLDSASGRAIVGAPNNIATGSAYCFELSGSTWISTSRLTPGLDVGGFVPGFGTCVGITGDHALVGTGKGNTIQVQACAYKRRAASPKAVWDLQANLTHAEPEHGDGAMFCAVNSTTAVVSNSPSDSVGKVTIYALVNGTWQDRNAYYPSEVQGGIFLGLRALALSPIQLFSTSLFSNVMDLGIRPLRQVVGDSNSGPANSVVVGTTLPDYLHFTLTHQGTIPVTVTLTTQGHTADFEVTPLQVSLPVGGSATISIHFKPQAVGRREFSLRFATDIPGDIARIETITGWGVAQADPLAFYQQPASCFTGQPLSPGMSGTGPMTYRWLKDGKPLANGSTRKIVPTAPGIYQVEVTNAHGTVLSRQVRVGQIIFPEVADLHLIPGEKAVWTTKTAGTDMVTEWWEGQPSLGGGPPNLTAPQVKASGGTSTLTLMADAAQIGAAARQFTLRVKMPALEGDADIIGGILIQDLPLTLQVYQPPRLELPFPENGTLTANKYFEGRISLIWGGPAPAAPVFKCTGLPPGIHLSGLGVSPIMNVIAGGSTKPGLYTVSASATFGRFKVPAVTRKIAVIAAEDLLPPGVYESLIPITDLEGAVPGSGLPLGGHISLTLQPTGSFSAKIRVGPKNISVGGALLPSANTTNDVLRIGPHFNLPLSPRGVQKCALVSGPGFIRLVSILAGNTWGPELAYLELTRPFTPAQEWVPGPHIGRHAAAIWLRSGVIGAAYGTVTVGKDCLLTYALTGPDGSTLTGTGYSIPGTPLDDRLTSFCYLRDSAGTALMGQPRFPAELDSSPENMTWVRTPRKGRLYPEGRQDTGMQLLTSRIDAATVKQYFASKDGYISLYVGDNSPSAFIVWDSALKATINPGESSRPQLTLSLSTSSGLFSGKWTSTDPDPLKPGRTITRTLPYKGILLPQRRMALGQILVPALANPDADPPTTASTSPIESGIVNLQPNP